MGNAKATLALAEVVFILWIYFTLHAVSQAPGPNLTSAFMGNM